MNHIQPYSPYSPCSINQKKFDNKKLRLLLDQDSAQIQKELAEQARKLSVSLK